MGVLRTCTVGPASPGAEFPSPAADLVPRPAGQHSRQFFRRSCGIVLTDQGLFFLSPRRFAPRISWAEYDQLLLESRAPDDLHIKPLVFFLHKNAIQDDAQKVVPQINRDLLPPRSQISQELPHHGDLSRGQDIPERCQFLLSKLLKLCLALIDLSIDLLHQALSA